MNMWGYTPSFLEEVEERFPVFLAQDVPENPLKAEYYLPKAVADLLAEKKASVKMLHSEDRWFGVTYVADKPRVVAALKALTNEGKYPDGLWK